MGGLAGPASAWRLTPQAAALLAAAAIGWVAIVVALPMRGSGAGAMGRELPAFLVAWTAMMAAMMLPSVAPVASLYSRSVTQRRVARLGLFTLGYLAVWIGAGVVAFALGRVVGILAAADPSLGIAAGVGSYLACGVYQLSSLKSRCLNECRSPISLFLRYASYRGALRDLRVGLHHGGYCLACCWSLMVVLVALGAMSLVPMVALAAVVMAEKVWSRGERFARVVGVVALLAAAATIWLPGLAPGFGPGM